MKLLTNNRYKELLAEANENTAREVTIINLREELRKKDEYIKKLKADRFTNTQPKPRKRRKTEETQREN